MSLTKRQLEKLYDNCKVKDKPECQMHSNEDKIILEGTISEIDGYITAEFKANNISIEK